MVRAGRGLGDGQCGDGGETERIGDQPAREPVSGGEPGFPGPIPLSTFFSLLILLKCYNLGEITESCLSIIQIKEIRNSLGSRPA